MTRINEAAEGRNDEMGLFEIVVILKQGWRYWMGGAVLGMLAAGVIISLSSPQYEAATVIQVGQIGQAGQVESATLAIERMTMHGFLKEVAQKLNLRREEARRLPGKMSLKILKGTELIELIYRDSTPEQARRGALTFFELLRERHQTMALPAIENLKSQLNQVQEQIAVSTARRKEIIQNLPRQQISSLKNEYTFLSLAFVQQDSELAQREAALKNALREPSTRPTMLFEGIAVDDEPVSPRKRRGLLLGCLGGFVLGVLGLIIRRSWLARYRQTI